MSKIGRLSSIAIVVVMMAVGGWLLYEANTKHVQKPQSGSTPNDSTAEPIKPADVKKSTRTVTSLKGVELRVEDWPSDNAFTSPLTLTGEVPGSWSFEASFPMVLTDWDGKIIAEAPATLQGDWTTDQYVPFTATLTFETPILYKTGSLILRKDNPSGLPANDDAIELPITYK